MQEKHKLSWRALRYSHTQDNIKLQIGLAFIFGLMLVLSMIFKNYLFGAFILIASVLLFHIKKNETPYVTIDIDHNGISVNNELTPYDKILAFYIEKTEEEHCLLYRLKGNIINPIKVIIIEPEIDSNELQTFLLKHLPQKVLKQSSTDKLINSV